MKISKIKAILILLLLISIAPTTISAEESSEKEEVDNAKETQEIKEEKAKENKDGFGLDHSSLGEIDFYLINEPYVIVDNWDNKSTPKKKDGGEITDGWFKYNNKYYKMKDGDLVEKNKANPSNFNASNGLGNLHIQFNFEEDFAENIGITINSREEGVEAEKKLSTINDYEAYLEGLPAGKYRIASIFDSNSSLKLPIDKQLDYPKEFAIDKDKTYVLNIYSKEKYKEEGFDDKAQELDKEKEECKNESSSDIKHSDDKEVIKDSESKIKTITSIITIFVILTLGFLGYKAYKHVK